MSLLTRELAGAPTARKLAGQYGISRRARSVKAKVGLRALLGKAPDAKEVGDRLSRLVKRMLGEAVIDASAKRITLQLHPDAAPVRIVVLPDGDLEVTGETASVGPAYHSSISRALAPVLAELDYGWEAEEPDPRTAMTMWLASELKSGATCIGIRAELAFVIDATVLTPMGPRDARWRDAVIADHTLGRDAFAWWDDAPGHAELAAAMLAMWLHVPWREALDEEEADVMRSVDGALRAARKANPELPIPYAEWADVMSLLGVSSERIAAARAKANGNATIGYRRYPIEQIVDGWTLTLPGAFVGHFEDDHYWATDGGRVVQLTTFSTDGTQTSQQLVDIAPPANPVVETINEDARRGRAEQFVEGDVHIVIGITAATPDVAMLTCKTEHTDTAWALEVWRSLRR